MSSKHVVALNKEFHATLQPRLEEEFEVIISQDINLHPDDAARCTGIILSGHTIINGDVLARFPNVVVVANQGVGTDHIDIPACTAAGVRASNTPDVLNGATADMGMALLLASARNVVEGDAIARSPSTAAFDGLWFGREVHGATLGIVGMGRIGQAVAHRGALGFGMRVAYHNRSRAPPEVEAKYSAQYCPTLPELLAASDYVMLCLPTNAETRHTIAAPQLAAMKRTATLINIGRGGLVNQEDLVHALRTGVIARAALDVTDPEPLPRDHPLLACPNVILTPHLGSATLATRTKMFELAVDNLRAGLAGQPMPTCLNPDVPARKTMPRSTSSASSKL